MKYRLKHGHDTVMLTPIIILKNDINQCNHMNWCQTRYISDTVTHLIRGVYVLHVSPIQDKMHKAADKSYANCSLLGITNNE